MRHHGDRRRSVFHPRFGDGPGGRRLHHEAAARNDYYFRTPGGSWERCSMILTIDQQDAVTELVNIAFSRTAAALSDLTGNRVELSVPEVGAYPIDHLQSALTRY